MIKVCYQPNYWYYFKGDFLNRVNWRCRKAIEILISVVIGALLLAGLYLLFQGTVLPILTNRVKELFDYKG